MFKLGDRVVVTGGVFLGAEGTVVSEGRGFHLVRLRVWDDQEVLVELPAGWLEQVEEADGRVAPLG